MISTRKFLFLAVIAATVVFVMAFQPSRAASCKSPDNMTRVSGSAHCLAIKTFLPEKSPANTLVVVLHGDLSSGGAADYIAPVASNAAKLGAVGVAMMRPGYTGDGRTSSGTASRDLGRSDQYRAEEMDSVAAAVAALKSHHKATRVVMVGHSGGAANAGVILGRAAPLIDAAILISCPCNIPVWREMRGRSPWPNAASPHDYLPRAPKTVALFLLTGENDRNTRPVIARDYAARAKAMGLNASFVEVPDAGHGFRRIARQPHLNEALSQAVLGR